MADTLYIPHARAITVLFDDLERAARSLPRAFEGTAGTVLERSNAAGYRFYAHQHYDGMGRKRERYVAGPIGAPPAEEAARALRARIAEVKELVPSLRLLGREGYNVVDARTYATLASLHNHGLFEAGAVLVGSHAFGVLVNKLGVRATPFATEGVDVARARALAFAAPPAATLLEMLRGSGVDFVAVPDLDHRKPSTSFKEIGKARFHFDLLAPARDESYPIVRVPELSAHATGLLHLGYLLAETQPAVVIAREGCCMVRTPLPERFAVHKLLVAGLRKGRSAKAQKDVRQAAVLAAALGELHPGALEAAVRVVPRSAKHLLAASLRTLAPQLVKHPRACEELGL